MLEIRLLGLLEVSAHGRALSFDTKKSEALLSMLVLRPGQALSREAIVGELWGDTEETRARRCLSSDLWRLKSQFKSAGLRPQDFVQCRESSIAFGGPGAHWVDVHAFEEGLDAAKSRPPTQWTAADIAAVEAALALYRGDLVRDLHYDHFLVVREALRAAYMRALEGLMQCHMFHADLDRAIDCGQRLLALDPLFELVHQELMLCHFRAGNRVAALRQFAACEQVLWDELQIEPLAETREIYARLLANEPARARAPRTGAQNPAERLGTALRHLEAATADVQTVRAELGGD